MKTCMFWLLVKQNVVLFNIYWTKKIGILTFWIYLIIVCAHSSLQRISPWIFIFCSVDIVVLFGKMYIMLQEAWDILVSCDWRYDILLSEKHKHILFLFVIVLKENGLVDPLDNLPMVNIKVICIWVKHVCYIVPCFL